jgi:3-oxoacyl-[acyl-carrier protein] reductase
LSNPSDKDEDAPECSVRGQGRAETDRVSGWSTEMRQRLVGMTPLGRFGHPDEVASVAVFLASQASSSLTGQTINVNGGIYMG